MMAVSHILVGGCSWLAYSKYTGAPLYEGMAIAAIASLAPDIDHPLSFVGKRLSLLSAPISAIFGHRGVTHSFIAVIAAVVAAKYYGGAYGFVASAIAVGYLSHLVADYFSNTGIPLLWPSKQRYAFPFTLSTGGFLEYVLQGIFVLVLVRILVGA